MHRILGANNLNFDNIYLETYSIVLTQNATQMEPVTLEQTVESIHFQWHKVKA